MSCAAQDPEHEAKLDRIARELMAFDVDWDEVEKGQAPGGATTRKAHPSASATASASSSSAPSKAAESGPTPDPAPARPALRPEQTALIKQVMSGLQIKPPPWASRFVCRL